MPIIKRTAEYAIFPHVSDSPLPLVVVGHRYLADYRGTMVMHRPFYLFTQVYDGEGDVSFENGPSYAVGRGDWFFAFPDQIVLYQEKGSSPWRYYWIGLRGEWVSRLLGAIGIGPQTLTRRAQPDSRVMGLFEAIMTDLKRGSQVGILSANAGVMRLLAILGENDESQGGHLPMASGLCDCIAAAKMFIENHFADGITVGDVTRHVGYERSYFSSRYKQATGQTLHSTLAQVRLAKARQLLRDTDFNLAAISRATGIYNVRTFSRWFTREMGVSPGKWRKASPNPD